MARRSLYNEKYNSIVTALSRLGATDDEIAEAIGVAVSTFSLWKKKYKQLSDSLKKGKVLSDVKVSESLYKKALGYNYTEDIAVTLTNGTGEGKVQRVEVVTVTKHVPADTTAQIFWLKNRRLNDWREKQDIAITMPDVLKVDWGTNDKD